MHVDVLIKDPSRIGAFDLIGFPGGFSYGDDIASGRVFAMKVRERLYPQLRESVSRGCCIIGACNGFQVLVQIGLLPGPSVGDSWPTDKAPEQTVALTDNVSARFCDRWVGMEYIPESVCVWTKGLSGGPTIAKGIGESRTLQKSELEDINTLPVAHGEGRFTGMSASTLDALERTGQVACRYRENYNGSDRAIAGICDATGRVFGLMPHPERYLEWTRHPYWTRLPQFIRSMETPGLRMFRNAVEAVSHASV